jgi:hypothetical protein
MLLRIMSENLLQTQISQLHNLLLSQRAVINVFDGVIEDCCTIPRRLESYLGSSLFFSLRQLIFELDDLLGCVWGRIS